MHSVQYLVFLAITTLALPALASEPGQPLDCSDWVIPEPGLTCAIDPLGCGSNRPWCLNGQTIVTTVEGRRLWVRYETNPVMDPLPCEGPEFDAKRLEIVPYDGSDPNGAVIAYIDEACAGAGGAAKMLDGIPFGKPLPGSTTPTVPG